MPRSLASSGETVLYVDDVMVDVAPGCRVEAWAPRVDGIAEVFHARIIDYGYPPHCHDTWTVLIVDGGAISYDLDTRSHAAMGQTVAVLPPGVIHNGRPAPGAPGFTKRVLYLDAGVVPGELVGAAVDHTGIEDAELRAALAALHRSLTLDEDVLDGESRLSLIRDRIIRHLDPAATERSRPERRSAKRLRSMLDEHVTTDLRLDDAATLLGRSKAHLIRSFTSEYGVSPHAYVVGRRIERARHLLLAGATPADVAAITGFYDQSHLTRHFKRHTSTTPAAYAASHA
jgi:AraC-like DNA-binding protein